MRLFLLFFFCFSVCCAQQLKLVKGQITDSLVLDGIDDERFAVFLPTQFDLNKKWPLLLVIETPEQEQRGIEAFKKAANERGYMMAAFDLPKKPDARSVILKMDTFLEALEKVLPVDSRLVSITGFGRGAALAVLGAWNSDKIQSVIPCSLNLLAVTDLVGSSKKFPFVGVVGDADFNFMVMQKATNALQKRNFNAHLVVFKGAHHWPDVEATTRALEKLELYAMKGYEKADPLFIEKGYKKEFKQIEKLRDSGNHVLAVQQLKRLKKNYEPWLKLDSLTDKIKNFKRTETYRAEKRIRNRIEYKEAIRHTNYLNFIQWDLDTLEMDRLNWWENEINALNSFVKSEVKQEQKMGARLKNLIFSAAKSHKFSLELDETEKKLFLCILMTLAQPEKVKPYFEIISLAAQLQEPGTALYYLESLLILGYHNMEALYNIEHTTLLKLSPEYNGLIKDYLGTARYDFDFED